MSGLRWILLAAGVLFIAALAWREARRGRQDAGSERQKRARHDDPPLEPQAAGDTTAMQPESAAWSDLPHPPRERYSEELPIIEMSAAELANPHGSNPVPLMQSTAAAVRAIPLPPPAPPPSIAEWPPEEIRRICSLRITPQRHERFAGRLLRQSLLATGFQHGELGIFHLPGDAGRAMMSVANLSRPGQLDPEMMDYQRFAGLHLFTVLPGRVSNREGLLQLFAVASELAQRLQGTVQDVNGRPLDAARTAELQQLFADAAVAPAAVE